MSDFSELSSRSNKGNKNFVNFTNKKESSSSFSDELHSIIKKQNELIEEDFHRNINADLTDTSISLFQEIKLNKPKVKKRSSRSCCKNEGILSPISNFKNNLRISSKKNIIEVDEKSYQDNNDLKNELDKVISDLDKNSNHLNSNSISPIKENKLGSDYLYNLPTRESIYYLPNITTSSQNYQYSNQNIDYNQMINNQKFGNMPSQYQYPNSSKVINNDNRNDTYNLSNNNGELQNKFYSNQNAYNNPLGNNNCNFNFMNSSSNIQLQNFQNNFFPSNNSMLNNTMVNPSLYNFNNQNYVNQNNFANMYNSQCNYDMQNNNYKFNGVNFNDICQNQFAIENMNMNQNYIHQSSYVNPEIQNNLYGNPQMMNNNYHNSMKNMTGSKLLTKDNLNISPQSASLINMISLKKQKKNDSLNKQDENPYSNFHSQVYSSNNSNSSSGKNINSQNNKVRFKSSFNQGNNIQCGLKPFQVSSVLVEPKLINENEKIKKQLLIQSKKAKKEKCRSASEICKVNEFLEADSIGNSENFNSKKSEKEDSSKLNPNIYEKINEKSVLYIGGIISTTDLAGFLCSHKGCKEFQKKITIYTPQISSFVLNQLIIDNTVHLIMIDPYANYIFQKLVENSPTETKTLLISNIESLFPSIIAPNVCGSHSLQFLATILKTQEEINLFSKLLESNCYFISTDNNSVYIMMKFISSTKEENRRSLNQIILKNIYKLCLNPYGVCVVSLYLFSFLGQKIFSQFSE